MRQKVSLELKVEALGLLKTGLSVSSVSKQLKIPSGVLQTWSQIYAREGVKGLAAYPKNICSGDIKAKILWSYRKKRVPLQAFYGLTLAQASAANHKYRPNRHN